jgi:asparagine synthase (glutamine-hydrolysing)
MCGIAGWLGPVATAAAPDVVLASMLDRIAHRGPDGRGSAALPGGAGMFGHVRLAVIDPACGQQPLWSRDGRSVLVFNGELYNYRELRAELSAHDIAWRTESDTEVLLELLLREGADALSRLRGMYAFAFWDGRRQAGLLARDPVGIKPLFVRREGASLWFASEAKAFPRTAAWRPELDPAQLHLLLNLRYPAGGAGLMRGVGQLAPGGCLEWGATGMRGWQVAPPMVPPVGANGVRAAVMDSVRAHLVADVPVASYLSGGVDSGVVTYAATRLGAAHIDSFTIDAGDDPRELDNARATAGWLGIGNHAGALAAAGPEVLDWLLWHLEVPKVNALQSAAVAQLASRRAKVCLSGLGGDELFLGYRAHRHLDSWARASRALGPLAPALGSVARGLMGSRAGFGEPWRAAAMLATGDASTAYALLRNAWDGALPRERLYGPRMLDQPLPDVREWIAGRWPSELPPVQAMAAFEWRNKMVDDLLWQEDRTSMGFGLEVRVPFADARLQAALAPLLCGHAGVPGRKSVLRGAFAGDVPAHVLERPKSGFQIDIATHLDQLFGTVLEQWLSPERVRRHGLFAPDFIRRLLALRRARAHRWHFFLLLLMAQAHRWIEMFEEDRVRAPAAPVFASELP